MDNEEQAGLAQDSEYDAGWEEAGKEGLAPQDKPAVDGAAGQDGAAGHDGAAAQDGGTGEAAGGEAGEQAAAGGGERAGDSTEERAAVESADESAQSSGSGSDETSRLDQRGESDPPAKGQEEAEEDRVAALQSRLDELQKQRDEDKARFDSELQKLNSSGSEDEENGEDKAPVSDEKFKDLEEKLDALEAYEPEIVKETRDVLGSLRGRVSEIDAREQLERQREARRQEIDKTYPDWRQDVNSPEFKQWQEDNLSQFERERFWSSEEQEEIVSGLKRYYGATNGSGEMAKRRKQVQSAKPPPTRTTAQKNVSGSVKGSWETYDQGWEAGAHD